MYKFKNKEDISVYFNDIEVLSTLSVWMNSTLGSRIDLAVVEAGEKEVRFESRDKTAVLMLTLIERGGCFALKATGRYDPSGTYGRGSHLQDFKGIGIDFGMPHEGKYIDAFMNCMFWQRPFIGRKISEMKERTQALVFDRGGLYELFMTVCDKDFKTELFPFGRRASLIAHSNTVQDQIDEYIFIGGIGNDVYALPELVVDFGLKQMKKRGKLRKAKKYPEIFEYLGWCSWDAFHMDVTEQNLLDKAQEFKEKDIPVRWMILDDMWGDVPCNDLKTMHSRELNSWEAAPERFPNGLKGAVKKLKEQYRLAVGIWHPTSGYWWGIDPNGPLAKTHGDLLEYTIPGLWPDGSRYMHSFEKRKIEKYYDAQHAFYKDCGIDFAKVDNQGSTERFSYRKGSIGVCSKNLHRAIEQTAKKYYDGALINCMGMPVENFWNRTYSNVNRFSGDFKPENRSWFIQHLLQCSYNAFFQGTVYTGDWDMWWSDDAQAKKNAVLRSMSGGPIYMSDELGRSVKEVIMPTVFSDGRIIRLENPALPCQECLFEDCETNGNIFKVFNTIRDCGVLAVFNLNKEEKPVRGEISSWDVNALRRSRYCLYDWFRQEARVLEKGEKFKIVLENYDDFRLFLLVPIKEGRAELGLMEKYMMPATFRNIKEGVQVLDQGTFAVYSETPLSGFEKMRENIYVKKVQANEILK